MRFWKCEYYEKWNFENVNFVKYEILKLWILWKMRLWKCEFCEKWDFEIVNFVKNEILEMWILWKMRLRNCEFRDKLRILKRSFFIAVPVTRACTSSISFCFSSASKLLYHFARRVFPARFWIKINLIGMINTWWFGAKLSKSCGTSRPVK